MCKFCACELHIKDKLSLFIMELQKLLYSQRVYCICGIRLIPWFIRNQLFFFFLSKRLSRTATIKTSVQNRNYQLSHLMTKPTKRHVRPAKTQISLGIRPVWSESWLSAWKILGPQLPTERTVKTPIRLGGCPGWSGSSLGAHAISLVLSWGHSDMQLYLNTGNTDFDVFWICIL